LKCAHKRLNRWSANGVFPALGLHVDNVKPESILADYPINPAIAGAPKMLAACDMAAAVSHRLQHV
jgi:hypothetical protein